MPKYYVKVMVEYSGEVEAESEKEAEEMGWDFDSELAYDGVYSIEVEEIEEDEDEEDEPAN
jgi:hypothetical protein